MTSPAVVMEPDGTYTIWVNDATAHPYTLRRYKSTNGTTWTGPVACTLPAIGPEPWHMDVQLVDGVYHMLLNENDLATPAQSRLFYLTSTDGLVWTDQTPSPYPNAPQPAIPITGYNPDLQRNYKSCMIARSGGPVNWDVWAIALRQDTNPEQWRAFLYRNTSLPTGAQIQATAQAELDLTKAFSGRKPFLLGDAFNRADTAVSLGTATDGHAWTAPVGTIGISGGAAYMVANGRSVIETGVADVQAQVDIAGTALAEWWFVLRCVDDSNWIRVGTNRGDGKLLLQKRVAGTITETTPLVYYPARLGDRIRVTAMGALYTLYRNGYPVGTFTETANQVDTRHGISVAAANVKLKNFAVRSLP